MKLILLLYKHLGKERFLYAVYCGNQLFTLR